MKWLRQIHARLFGLRRRRLPAESTRAQRGRFGEDLAADYCRRELGYRLIVRNWSYKRDEIDLVCKDGEVLVFIEVRARAADALVSGYHSVDKRKKRALHRVCSNYMRQMSEPPKHFRFDIMDVALSKDGYGDVRHYPSVSLWGRHFSVKHS